MGVHPFPAIDPATNYLTMTGGAGAAPMHAYSAAMTTLGTDTHATVAISAVNTAATGGIWHGSAQIQAAASVTNLNTAATDAADKALLKAELAQAAGELHTMTVARMVTHVQANANRAESAVDNQINPWMLGALTPRITELELEYVAMWANNAQAGVGYGAGLDSIGGALAALSALPALAGGSLAAPAMAGAQIAETAAITGLSAAMSTAEQAATAVISPAVANTTSSAAATNMLGNTPLAAPSTASTPPVQPMAAVQTHPTPTPPSLTQAQAPVMGMFAPPPSAAVTPPTTTASPPVQMLTPATGPGTAPAVTSFVRPAEPFAAPPPTAGRATGLGPGMLNAAALRGPVTTAPLTTTATSTVATAAQPLAYVPPEPPRPPVPPTPPQALQQSDTAQVLHATPPPAPSTSPPPQAQLLTPPTPATPGSLDPPRPPSAPQAGPPAPSAPGLASGPDAGTAGTQLLGFGPGQAPLPIDPTITTTTTSQAPMPDCDLDDVAKLERQTKDWDLRYGKFLDRLKAHNQKPTEYNANDPAQVKAFHDYQQEEKDLRAEEGRLLQELSELRAKLGECGIKMFAKNGQEIIIQWPDGSKTTIPNFVNGSH